MAIRKERIVGGCLIPENRKVLLRTFDGAQNLISIKGAINRADSYDYDTLNCQERIIQPQHLLTTYS
jgi:hypothetical protein